MQIVKTISACVAVVVRFNVRNIRNLNQIQIEQRVSPDTQVELTHAVQSVMDQISSCLCNRRVSATAARRSSVHVYNLFNTLLTGVQHRRRCRCLTFARFDILTKAENSYTRKRARWRARARVLDCIRSTCVFACVLCGRRSIGRERIACNWYMHCIVYAVVHMHAIAICLSVFQCELCARVAAM